MAHILLKPDWRIGEKEVTSERAYRNRRDFLRQCAVSGMGILGGVLTGQKAIAAGEANDVKTQLLNYPFKRHPSYNPKWKTTNPSVVTSYNNFYEFSTNKSRVQHMVGNFQINPWTVQVSGLVENPKTLDMNSLPSSFSMQERIYRFRCVEAWSMVVPWSGFSFSDLIKLVRPKPEATFVKFTTFNRPDQAPGMRFGGYQWPYVEGLTIEEARHELTFMATGIYGKPLPKQNGAPIRLVVPWKYGYKSIKSIDKIEFTKQQPKTFWENLAPNEYPFESNVDPRVPHPRWSQATERVVDTGLRRRTKLYNGYAEQVAKLY